MVQRTDALCTLNALRKSYYRKLRTYCKKYLKTVKITNLKIDPECTEFNFCFERALNTNKRRT